MLHLYLSYMTGNHDEAAWNVTWHFPGPSRKGSWDILQCSMCQVHYERTFCLACFWRKHNLRAPTSYISHFASVPCCGEYSLQLVGFQLLIFRFNMLSTSQPTSWWVVPHCPPLRLRTMQPQDCNIVMLLRASLQVLPKCRNRADGRHSMTRRGRAMQDEVYHNSLMQHANISRCNFMKALHRSAPLEVAHGPAPFRYRSTRLMVRPAVVFAGILSNYSRATQCMSMLIVESPCHLPNFCTSQAVLCWHGRAYQVEKYSASPSLRDLAYWVCAGLGVHPRAQAPAAQRGRMSGVMRAEFAVHCVAVVRSPWRLRRWQGPHLPPATFPPKWGYCLPLTPVLIYHVAMVCAAQWLRRRQGALLPPARITLKCRGPPRWCSALAVWHGDQ